MQDRLFVQIAALPTLNKAQLLAIWAENFSKRSSPESPQRTPGPYSAYRMQETRRPFARRWSSTIKVVCRWEGPPSRPASTATRCILGIYIGFNPPSYQSVAACLKDCFLPKVNLHRDYPGIVNEWPAYGVMHNLVVDGGLEFYSASLEQVCLSLNINWIAAPRRTPWFKGKIERFLGTMNRAVAHGVPGTTFSNIFEKGVGWFRKDNAFDP